MNKQEKEELVNQLNGCLTNCPSDSWDKGYNEGIKTAVRVARNLPTVDEPQKVKVKPFVAEWFEENKHNLNFAIFELCEAGKAPVDLSEGLTDFEKWFYLNQDIETLVRMVDGYEVEEEPKYYVELPFEEWDEDAAELKTRLIYLGFDITSDETTLITSKNGWRNFKTRLDEETIKSIDERYWPFAVSVEKV